MLTGEKLKD